MKNIENELPEDPEQSAIINDDAELENRSVDPGFVSNETDESFKSSAASDEQVKKRNTEPDEQGTERGAPGLGELDGTNPGSNHHPMDNDISEGFDDKQD